MKWKFDLLRKVQLEVMTLLPIVMGIISCKRNAPRYEPDPLSGVTRATISPSWTWEPSNSIANKLQPYNPFGDLLKHWKNSKDIENLLKDIGWNGGLILNVGPPKGGYLQNDFSTLIQTNQTIVSYNGKDQPNGLLNRLCIFFRRNWQDGSWDGRRLVGTESITIRSNPILPNAVNHSFVLIAFLIHIPANNDSKDHLVAFVKLDQNWYFYNDGTKTGCSTEGAMRLASERGTIFFYQNIT